MIPNRFLGLDSGDRKALDAKFKPTDAPPCQFDKEDLRFVLKGNFLCLYEFSPLTSLYFFHDIFLFKQWSMY